MLKVKVISHTTNPERTVATAARLCHSSKEPDVLCTMETEEGIEHMIRLVRKKGHLSVLEHASFTFAISGVSRVTTHQLMRHRIASYSQRSQRHVDHSNSTVVIPATIKDKAGEALTLYMNAVDAAEQSYQRLRELGIPKEDARYVLPQGVDTSLTVTFNARSLHNFFELRLASDSQWEIRELADKMRVCVMEIAPLLFCNIDPNLSN